MNDNFIEWMFFIVVVNFWVIFFINQRQRAYIKKIEPMAENWILILKKRDEMIKNGTWDGEDEQ